MHVEILSVDTLMVADITGVITFYGTLYGILKK